MGRFLLLLAVLLMAASIGLLVILVSGAENDWANQIFKTALCEEGEEFTQWFGNYVPRSGSSSGGRETAFYCMNSKGDERDVTLNTIGIMAGGFVIPFLSSLTLFFVAIGVMVRNGVKSATKNVFEQTGGTPAWNAVTRSNTTVIDLRDGSAQGEAIPPEKMAQVQQILNSFGVQDFSNVHVQQSGNISPEKMAQVQQIFDSFGISNASAVAGNTLTERLQQIEDAQREGLISQEEYSRLRQAILDNLDN